MNFYYARDSPFQKMHTKRRGSFYLPFKRRAEIDSPIFANIVDYHFQLRAHKILFMKTDIEEMYKLQYFASNAFYIFAYSKIQCINVYYI